MEDKKKNIYEILIFIYSGTKETIDLTNKMAERGAHAALVVTPAFFKSRMNAEAMLRHYTHVSKIQIRNYFKKHSD